MCSSDLTPSRYFPFLILCSFSLLNLPYSLSQSLNFIKLIVVFQFNQRQVFVHIKRKGTVAMARLTIHKMLALPTSLKPFIVLVASVAVAVKYLAPAQLGVDALAVDHIV